MATHEVAKAFTPLLSEGRTQEACETYWAESVVALEDMPGPMARLQGAAAIAGKAKWWVSNHEVHGDQFAIRFNYDLTPRGGSRTSMDEIGLYSVMAGKITEERFSTPRPSTRDDGAEPRTRGRGGQPAIGPHRAEEGVDLRQPGGVALPHGEAVAGLAERPGLLDDAHPVMHHHHSPGTGIVRHEAVGTVGLQL